MDILLTLLGELLQKRFLRFGLYWLRKASIEEKKALMVVRWVIKHKGQKKAKRRNKSLMQSEV